MKTVQRGVALVTGASSGIGKATAIVLKSAVLFLCIASFVLDLTAFMRDMVYAAQWMNNFADN